MKPQYKYPKWKCERTGEIIQLDFYPKENHDKLKELNKKCKKRNY